MINCMKSIMKRRLIWLKNIQNFSALFILVSTALEWNIVAAFPFLLLLNAVSVSLLVTFSHFVKEKGVLVATIPYAVFIAVSFGMLGVPEHLANNQLPEAVVDGLVALFQLAAAGISLLLLKI